jgi:cell division protein FtsA
MAGEIQEDGYLKISGLESKPADDVRYGLVEQGSGAAFKLNELIHLLENSARIQDIEYISVSVGAKSMRNVSISVSHFVGASKTVSDNLIDEMITEAESKIRGESVAVYDVIPLWYELDGKRMDDPVGKQGTQLIGRYNVVYGNTLIAEKLEGCIERTGKVIEYRCLAVDALATAVLDEHERDNGCALINLGGLTSTLSIFEHGALQQLVVVPLGGKTITKDIQEFGINEKNAERLKCAVGKALESQVQDEIYVSVAASDPELPAVKISSKMLAMAIEARMDEIMKPIFDAIDIYTGNLANGIILTGGGALLNGLSEYFSERTGFNVRFGHYTDWLTDKTDPKFINPIYAQLVGTLLLNHEYRDHHPLVEKVKEKRKIPRGGAITNLMKDFFSDDNKLE